jgi:uncharacterized protein YndB with AHSA1/START domain
VRKVWIERDIDAPAKAVWELLVDPMRWPEWGPSVRDVALDGDVLELGASGKVGTVIGRELDFEITRFEPGERWAWSVAGWSATDHRVTPLGPHRCRVGFGVAWPAVPYLGVCRVALRRLDRIATTTTERLAS